MASTQLYAHAPEAVFFSFASPSKAKAKPKPKSKSTAGKTIPDNTVATSQDITWQSPPIALAQLYAMSQCLNSSDFEITPVQAWFLLDGADDMKHLLRKGAAFKIEELKRRLAEIVGCFAFGAVMDVAKFWGIVKDVLSDTVENWGFVS